MVRLVALSLVTLFALAGCMGGGGDDDGGDSTGAPTTTGPTFAGAATAVEITSSPASAPAEGKAVVCFTVSGSGRVGHVAIHWDDATHATSPGRTFNDYNLGGSYPNNRTSPDPAGYDLQPTGTRYCTAATMPGSGSIFVVAHVIDANGPEAGDLSTERQVDVAPGGADITIQNSAYTPATLSVRAGETVVVRNNDAFPHTVTHSTTGTPLFDTGDINGGQSKTFSAPSAPGTYAFKCSRHAQMQGTLTVTVA